MRAKKCGRSELLAWVNSITQSDYPKIEYFSDAVAMCQIIDAFFENVTPEIMKLKLNSKDKEDWVRNWALLNVMLGRQKSLKTVDPIKLSKGNFSANFEFVQYLYDFIYKTFNTVKPKSYKGLKRRIDILKYQYGNRVTHDIKKYLPSHLLTNDVLLQIDKEKYFGERTNSLMLSQDESDNEEKNNTTNDNSNGIISKQLVSVNRYFKSLEQDLKRRIDTHSQLEKEITEIEEERDYYLTRNQTILDLCEDKKTTTTNDNTLNILDQIIEIITNVPEEFQ